MVVQFTEQVEAMLQLLDTMDPALKAQGPGFCGINDDQAVGTYREDCLHRNERVVIVRWRIDCV